MSTEASRDYWYPVATAKELDDGPISVQLLGERVVVFRVADRPAALRDLCIHRGTPLSMGHVQGETVVCAYHGWRYNADGACVGMPQRPTKQIPSKARVQAYKAEEKYGVVWVCLGEPRASVPEFAEYDDPQHRVVFSGSYVWEAGAARMMENFLDPAHFAFVHPGILGDPRRPEVFVGPIKKFDDGFGFEMENEMPAESVFGVSSDTQTDDWIRDRLWTRYRLPYYVHLVRDRRHNGPSERYALFIAIQPISSTSCKRFTWAARNYALDETLDQQFLSWLDITREQDRRIVESQRPEELPLDLTAEMHLRDTDLPAVTFRRLLAKTGLEESALLPQGQETVV